MEMPLTYESNNRNSLTDSEKEIVSLEQFVYKMIQNSYGCKYLYEEMIVGCMLGISHKFSIRCNETPQEVYDKYMETMSLLYANQ